MQTSGARTATMFSARDSAVLAMGIAALRKRLQKSEEPVAQQLKELGQGVTSLADGQLHQMSRQLHPSILGDLGLAAALHDECRVFSEMQKIPVRFKGVRVPKSLSPDVALCLYRVAQEILRNIAQHAGAREVRFDLIGTRGEIKLLVRDMGGGFDLPKAKEKKRGLGLISMEERVRMVNGVFKIQSAPGEGTQVEVRVPWRAA